MMATRNQRAVIDLPLAPGLAFLCLATSACTTVAPASIEPIEERNELLYEQVEFEMRLSDVILLNPYLDTESPRVDEFDAAQLDLIKAAELLVEYSVGLIDAAQIESDSEAIDVVVVLTRDLYSQLRELPFIAPRLGGVDVEAALSEAAGQANPTRALRATAPVSNMIAAAMRQSVDSASELFDLAFDETYGKVMEENRLFIEYTDHLVSRRNDILARLLMIEAARNGDASAWQALLDGNEELFRGAVFSPDISMASIDSAESIITARLGTMMETWNHLQPSWVIYQETLAELYAVQASGHDNLRVARFVIDEWDKAQRQLAKGRPAAFIRVTGDLAYLALRRATRR